MKLSTLAIILFFSNICYGQFIPFGFWTQTQEDSLLPADVPILTFAVIGDYGKYYLGGEDDVASMINSWGVDLIVTTGDNNYEWGSDSSIDKNIGQFYSNYIYPYSGVYGEGSQDSINRFFPTPGNHEWYDAASWNNVNNAAYKSYFTIDSSNNGNERYYRFRRNGVQFFMINSGIGSDSSPSGDCCQNATDAEPDQIHSTSTQAIWFQSLMSAVKTNTDVKWRFAVFHAPAYGSGVRLIAPPYTQFAGSTPKLRWPFESWGNITAVFAGHSHWFERLNIAGVPYFTSGTGGGDLITYQALINEGVVPDTLPESEKLIIAGFGASKVTCYSDSVNFAYITVDGTIHDKFTIVATGTLSLTSPTDSALINDSFFLTWDSGGDSVSYDVQISNDIDFKNIVLEFSTGVGETSYELHNGAIAEGTYYWHVRLVKNEESKSDWTPYRMFTVY